VRPVYRKLPDRIGTTVDELASIAGKPSWEGYFGSPAKANANFGKEAVTLAIAGNADFIARAVHGENFSKHARYPEGAVPPPYTEPPEERVFADKLEQWLDERKKP
jgi:hypothetical protein